VITPTANRCPFFVEVEGDETRLGGAAYVGARYYSPEVPVAGFEDLFRRQFDDLFRGQADVIRRHFEDAFRRQSEGSAGSQPGASAGRQSDEFFRRHPMREPTVVLEERSATTNIHVDTFVAGDISGDVVVDPNVHLRVKGDVRGNLVVKAHAVVHVQGDVSGDVLAMGSLLVEGDIGGHMVIQPH